MGQLDPVRNLGRQRVPAAKQMLARRGSGRKDAPDSRLHALVCNGQVDLKTAQQAMIDDWVTAYQLYVAP
jgi:hypothetical protein